MPNTPVFPTLPNTRLTSPFGWRTHPETGVVTFHHGIDLAPAVPGTTGVPIFASQTGQVMRVSEDSSRGRFIEIEHTADNYSTHYLHLSNTMVSVGHMVTKGDRIGTMGTTGTSTGIHLDFGVSTTWPTNFGSPGSYVNPETYLEGALPPDPDPPEPAPGEWDRDKYLFSQGRQTHHRRR